MKQLLAWIAALFGSKPKKPPVIVKPPDDKPKPVWLDKRPIGMVMLSNYVTWTDTDNYMNGDVDFKVWLVAHANNCIHNMKLINAQGLVCWDPGGSKWPRSYTYYGDPTLAPADVDIFFTTIRQAGFRTGVCLRPDKIVWGPSQYWERTPLHYTVASPLENLAGKVEYAKKRWGCTLFYVDSNVGAELQPNIDNTGGYGSVLPANIFAELHKMFPDCLFIPEWHNQEYMLCCMPYYHSALSSWKMPSTGGFVVPVGDTPWTVDELKQVIKLGNILLPRVWYDAPELTKIKAAYENNK